MAVNEQQLFDNDYSFLNLPASGSAVRSPINIDQGSLPPNIIAAINSVAPIKLPEMDTPLNFDPFDLNVNNEGLIGAENFSEFLKQIKDEIKAEYDLGVINEDPVAIKEAEDKMVEVIAKEEEIIAPVADPIINPAPVAPPVFTPPDIPRPTPQPTPVRVGAPVTKPILADSSLINNELESLNNPTAAMYSTDGGSMGLGSPMGFYSGGSSPITSRMGISGSELMSGVNGGSGFSSGMKNVLGKIVGLGKKAADLGAFGLPAQILSKGIGAAYDKYISNKDSDVAPTLTGAGAGAGDGNIPIDAQSGMMNPGVVTGEASGDLRVSDLINQLYSRGTVNPARSRLSRTDARGDSMSSGTMGFTQGNFGPGVTKGGLGGGKSTRGSAADMNAAMTAGIAKDKGSAMNVLYGGAGSSFESGRNEYTESGQYDIDREARQAAFDASNERDRIARGEPYKKLTAEETQQAVRDLQSRIAGPGMTSAQGRDNTPLNMDQLAITDPVRFNAIMGAMNPSKRESNNPSPFMGIPGQGGIRSIRRG